MRTPLLPHLCAAGPAIRVMLGGEAAGSGPPGEDA